MPLSRRQFELGVDPEAEDWMGQVYGHLEGHRDSAYSYDEVRKAIRGGSLPQAELNKFNSALDVLVRIGAVNKAEVDGKDYYAYYQEMDTKSWKPKPSKIEIHKFR